VALLLPRPALVVERVARFVPALASDDVELLVAESRLLAAGSGSSSSYSS
jgi:hypothetical protein